MKKSLLKSLRTFSILLLVSSFVAVSCNQQKGKPDDVNDQKLKGHISISGAFALYPLTIKWVEEFTKLHPKVRIDVSAGGAGKGLTDALSGMVDLGMFSRGLTQAEIDKGTWWIAVARDAVFSTCNANNPVIEKLKETGISRQKFSMLFITGEADTWGSLVNSDNKDKINVYTRSDACGAAQEWGQFLGKNQEDILGVGVYGDPGMADAIKNDIYGIGYNNIIYIYDMKSREKYEGLEVVPLDLDDNGTIDSAEAVYNNLDQAMEAIKNNVYPTPPARELYFVSGGKPESDVVIEFLRWILTEGQKYVNECGYVELTQEIISKEIEKL